MKTQLDTVTDLEKKEEVVRGPVEGNFVHENICLLPEVGDTVSTRMCGICKKNFLNSEYVSKHILNKHRDLIQIKQNKTVLLEVIRTEFLKDPNAKIPNIVPKKANLWEKLRGMSHRNASEVDILDTTKKSDDIDKSKLISYGKL